MKYKVTYLAYLMATAFVRISDGAILYANENEDFVIEYANQFCAVRGEGFIIE